jgi:hypothetical protein
VSVTLEPREVEKPFLRRWTHMTTQLLVRSPIRFGLMIAALGVLDHAAIAVAENSQIQRPWADRLGTLLLPPLWVLVGALARGADDRRRSADALLALTRARVWWGALRAGATLAAFLWIISWALQGLGGLTGSHRPQGYLRHPGELLTSIVVNVAILQCWVGLCYCPLLVLQPQLDVTEALHLSRRASELNGRTLLFLFLSVVALAGVTVATVLPLYGMTVAAVLAFPGILNYVAYRDIFERRSENAPERVRAVYPAARSAAVPIAESAAVIDGMPMTRSAILSGLVRANAVNGTKRGNCPATSPVRRVRSTPTHPHRWSSSADPCA